MATVVNIPPDIEGDWFPDEFKIHDYIFNVWQKVCAGFGYGQVKTSILENTALYAIQKDRPMGLGTSHKSGQQYLIRSEMIVPITRLVSRMYPQVPKPIRVFSIGNCIENSKETWQLSFHVFGCYADTADWEILSLAHEILAACKIPEGSYEAIINDVRLVDEFLEDVLLLKGEKKKKVLQSMHLPQEEYMHTFANLGLKKDHAIMIDDFLHATSIADLQKAFPLLAKSRNLHRMQTFLEDGKAFGYTIPLRFSSSFIPNAPVYDGRVFSIRDTGVVDHLMFAEAGRYDALAGRFGVSTFPGVGGVMNSFTLYNFLKDSGIAEALEDRKRIMSIYIPLLEWRFEHTIIQIAKRLRKSGMIVHVGIDVMSKKDALAYAAASHIPYILFLGEKEEKEGIAMLQEIRSGEQTVVQVKAQLESSPIS